MAKYVIGVDLGGTTVKLGVFKDQGELVKKWEIKTDTSESGKNILTDIAKTIENTLYELNINKDKVLGIGIGVPGPVDDSGIVHTCVNLGWGTVDVKSDLEDLTGLCVCVDNDANIAGIGEMWQGGGKGMKNIVFVTLGTGVGGGVIVNGKIIHGQNGAGGEIGHMPIVFDDAESCNCGKKGCLETVASATGIVRETTKYLNNEDDPSILREIEYVTAKDVFDAAKKGDDVAVKMVNKLGRYLGIALACISATVDPMAFVVGGGVSKAGPFLLNIVKKYYQEHAFYGTRDAEFSLAELGNDAGIYGGAYLAKNNG